MNEWGIIVIRLQTLLSRLEEAYDHVCIIQGQGSETAQRINRAVWSARCEIREALPLARNLRDDTNVSEESEATSGK